MAFSIFSDLISPTKYKVPNAPQVDIDKEQLANVESNLASFEAAKGLAEQFNDFMQAQVSKRLKTNVPELEGLQAQAAENYGRQLRGELSLSDSATAQRKSVAGTLMRGTAGSQAGSATVLRDLGLTQYGVQQQAQAALPNYLSAMAAIKSAPLFDFSNVFISPMQRIGAQWQNKQSAWNVQNLKNQLKVQPEPWQKALAGFGDSLLTAAASYYTMGGGLGGAGGGGGSSPTFNVGDYMQRSRMGSESGGYGGQYSV